MRWAFKLTDLVTTGVGGHRINDFGELVLLRGLSQIQTNLVINLLQNHPCFLDLQQRKHRLALLRV